MTARDRNDPVRSGDLSKPRQPAGGFTSGHRARGHQSSNATPPDAKAAFKLLLRFTTQSLSWQCPSFQGTYIFVHFIHSNSFKDWIAALCYKPYKCLNGKVSPYWPQKILKCGWFAPTLQALLDNVFILWAKAVIYQVVILARPALAW